MNDQPPPPAAGPDFIGALISLTSRADIRYQGFLANIDPAQATIALENVRSWGTEGRLGRPQDEIPPNDTVYDFIVFRASDVKDLKIDDQNPRRNQSPQVPFQDPAILGSSAPPPGANYYRPPPPHMQNGPGASRGLYGPPAGSSLQGSTSEPTAVPPAQTPTSTPAAAPKAPVIKKEPLSKVPPSADQVADDLAKLAVNKTTTTASSGEGSQSPAAPRNNGAPRNQTARTPRAGGMYDIPRSYGPEVPSDDYDFESANAKFEKARAAMSPATGSNAVEVTATTSTSNGTNVSPSTTPAGDGELDAIPPPDPKTFYDKKAGFFDNISSEVKERHERPPRGGRGGGGGGGRGGYYRGPDGLPNRPRGGARGGGMVGGGGRGRSMRMAEEKKNLQTFGDTGSEKRRYVPGAGPSRGGRGRGRGGAGQDAFA